MSAVVVVVNRALDDRIARVPRVQLPAGALRPVPDGHYPQNFLIVGTDVRIPEATQGTGARADVMILLRVRRHSAEAVWFPRDLAVSVPGQGTQKLNAAYALGGARLAVETLESNFDLPINHYVELQMTAFPALVDALGGVRLSFPEAQRDDLSGLDVAAGCATFDGDRALGLVRSRNVQVFRDGRWELAVEYGDLSRVTRQQRLLGAVASTIRQRVHDHPASLVRATDALLRNVRIDDALSRAAVLAFGRTLLAIGGSDLRLETLPVAMTPDDQSTLSLATGADQTVRGLGGALPPSALPSVSSESAVGPTPC
jgi:LCP family protein required for cell wall assembly